MSQTSKFLRAAPYFVGAILFFVLPSLITSYKGHTGKLLVHSKASPYTNFNQTVIYLYDHSINGAAGIVLNKPADTEDIEESVFKDNRNAEIFYGGPVAYPDKKSVLLQKPESRDKNDIQKVYVVQFDDLQTLLPEESKKQQRIYLGYAGWFTGQLEAEILNGAWKVIDYDPTLLSETPIESLWLTLSEKK